MSRHKEVGEQSTSVSGEIILQAEAQKEHNLTSLELQGVWNRMNKRMWEVQEVATRWYES